MKIVVAGGTGFIGSHLCHTLIQARHEVTVLSRHPTMAKKHLPESVIVVEWDGVSSGALDPTFEGKEALINLCGEPLFNARWTESRKQIIRHSRTGTTRLFVEALSRTTQGPKILVNASGVGFYGAHPTQTMTEASPNGTGFLADLCVAWEREARRAQGFGVRVLVLRFGMVLGKSGGALPKMALPFRFFLGGPILPGTQKVSWIHQKDLSDLIEWLLHKPEISGPVNAVAPESVSMKEFCKALGHALGRPSWFPVPGFILNLALGEMATLMTTGQAVRPVVADQTGFTFSFPRLDSALRSLL